MRLTTGDNHRFLQLTNDGLLQVGQVLSEMAGQEITVHSPESRYLKIAEIPFLFGDPERPGVALYQESNGEITEQLLLVLELDSAQKLVDALVGDLAPKSDIFTGLGWSALLEVMNIIGNSFLTVIADETGLSGSVEVPSGAVDMMAAVIGSVFSLRDNGDHVRVATTEFSWGDETLKGYLLILPAPATLDRILAAGAGPR